MGKNFEKLNAITKTYGRSAKVGEIFSYGLWGNKVAAHGKWKGFNCTTDKYGHVMTGCAKDPNKCGSGCIEIPKVGPSFYLNWKGNGDGSAANGWQTCGSHGTFNMSCISSVEVATQRQCSDATTPCKADEVLFKPFRGPGLAEDGYTRFTVVTQLSCQIDKNYINVL